MAATAERKFLLKKADWNGYAIQSDLEIGNIDVEQGCLNKVVNDFSMAISKAANACIPVMRTKNRRQQHTAALNEALHRRNVAFARMRGHRTHQRVKAWNEADRDVKKTAAKCRLAKKRDKLIEAELNDLKLWRLADHDVDMAATIVAPVNGLNGQPTRSDIEAVKAFVHHYAGVCKTDKTDDDGRGDYVRTRLKNINEKQKSPNQTPRETDLPFTMKELENALASTEKGKAPGRDKVMYELLTHLGATAKIKLLDLFNRSWQSGKVPAEWKVAVIKPLPKQGKDLTLTASYRPISLTSCVCKLLERMVNARLATLVEEGGFLSELQGGFRSNRQVTDHVVRLCQDVSDGMHASRMQHTAAVFFDLAQAYDRVWRDALLVELANANVGGKMFDWIQDFLRDRKIQVKVNNMKSPLTVVEEGLPQGSSLSCMLFIVFLNRVSATLDKHADKGLRHALFVDDMSIWATNANSGKIARAIQAGINAVKGHCKMYKLKLSAPKTVGMLFTRAKKNVPDVTVHVEDGKPLAWVESFKFLGVWISPDLRFKTHCRRVASAAAGVLGNIRQLDYEDCLTAKSIRKLVNT